MGRGYNFTVEDVMRMIKVYDSTKMSTKDLAKRFDIPQQTAVRVVSGKYMRGFSSKRLAEMKESGRAKP